MRRIALLSVLVGLLLAVGSSDHAGQPARAAATSDRVVPAPRPCSQEYIEGRVTTSAPQALVCEGPDLRLWQVVMFPCVDGGSLVHAINGWGRLGEPFHAGAMPGDVYAACMTR